MLLDQTLVLYLAKTVALNVVRMISMLYGSSQCCTEDLNVVRKISMLYGRSQCCTEDLNVVRKISMLYGRYQCCKEDVRAASENCRFALYIKAC